MEADKTKTDRACRQKAAWRGIDKGKLTDRIKMKALELGFSHAGIIPCEDLPEYAAHVEALPSYDRFTKSNPTSFHAGCFPSRYFPQGRSIVCATLGVSGIDYPEKLRRFAGRIYLARSYTPLPESLAGRRVEALSQFMEGMGIGVYRGKIEYPARPACAKAGIISYGNNNFAYTEEDGSFIILYTWLVDAELEYETRPIANGCPPGCTRCIDACPTRAIEKPRQLNPMRCILLNNLMPEPAVDTDLIGAHLHGCDICQEVCPRNHGVLTRAVRKDPFLEELAKRFDLERLLFLEDGFEGDDYLDMVRPIMYNYIRDPMIFRRNAAHAMGNSGDAHYLPALEKATEQFKGTIVEEAARHAIEQLKARNSID